MNEQMNDALRAAWNRGRLTVVDAMPQDRQQAGDALRVLYRQKVSGRAFTVNVEDHKGNNDARL